MGNLYYMIINWCGVESIVLKLVEYYERRIFWISNVMYHCLWRKLLKFMKQYNAIKKVRDSDSVKNRSINKLSVKHLSRPQDGIETAVIPAHSRQRVYCLSPFSISQ